MRKIMKYFNSLNFSKPKVCIILGSGLGSFQKEIKKKVIVDYDDIPGFLNTSVEGHNGRFIFGEVNSVPIICADGRFHYYEGYNFNQVGMIVKTFSLFNPALCIITNSSGCLNLDWELGSLMLVNKFIDYSFIKSVNPEYHDFKSKKYFNHIKEVAIKLNITLNNGNYTFTTGPTYETSAEIKEIIELGGSAVGMSTFPEFLKSQELNMETIVLSCLTNYGAGLIRESEITHKYVLINADKSKNMFNKLLTKFIESM